MELTEAKCLALQYMNAGDPQWIGLDDALGRVLARTVIAHRDLPGESRSRWDGFAVRSSDTAAALQKPLVLDVLPGLIAAGHPMRGEAALRSNRCIRILTGAPLPLDADAVIPQEDVSMAGDQVIVQRAVKQGDGRAYPGEEVRRGDLLASRGEILTPTRLAIIAALGHTQLPVFPRPRVALLATGDEVRELGENMEGPVTVCNNRYLLSWLTRLHGGIPISLGMAPDHARYLAQRLDQAGEADLVVTTGGIGRGDRDFVLEAWKMLGVQTLFRSLNLVPGKNTALGHRGRQVFCALPGNPWGAQLVFHELVNPMLGQAQGLSSATPPSVAAILEKTLNKKPDWFKAVRGALNLQTVPATFSPLPANGRSLFESLRTHFAYTLLGPHVVEVPAGSEIQVHMNDLPPLSVPALGLDREPLRAD